MARFYELNKLLSDNVACNLIDTGEWDQLLDLVDEELYLPLYNLLKEEAGVELDKECKLARRLMFDEKSTGIILSNNFEEIDSE